MVQRTGLLVLEGGGHWQAIPDRRALIERFKGQPVVTVACGTTCAYHGDGRDIREYLVANDAVQALREAGHVVHFLLFDDNLNGLELRQLRVAVDKDPERIQAFEHHCGRPLADVPNPTGGPGNYSKHFQQLFLQRLSLFGCHPTLIGTADLYKEGLYGPYVRYVVENQLEIRRFLNSEFPQLRIGKLFVPVCPNCGYLDECALVRCDRSVAELVCGRCNGILEVPANQLRGKLSWKLDCAVRWVLFKIDAEPFNKRYLEPQSGTFAVSLALANRFFGHVNVAPIQLGMTAVDPDVAPRLMSHLPSETLRSLMTEHWARDLHVTQSRLLTAAGRAPVYEGQSFLDVIKRLVTTWALEPLQLDNVQLELLVKGVRFASDFLDEQLGLFVPDLRLVNDMSFEELVVLYEAVCLSHSLRRECSTYAEFEDRLKNHPIVRGAHWSPVILLLRQLFRQSRGVPARRFLYGLPEEALNLLKVCLEWKVEAWQPAPSNGAGAGAFSVQ